MNDRIGKKFIDETKYAPGKLPSHDLSKVKRPDVYKRYPGATLVSLPPPEKDGGIPLWNALERRRSVRAYSDRELSKAQLSQLLWASQGVTAEVAGYRLRTAPSAGALYPIETYLIVNRVKGIDAGLYHYDVENHKLELIEKGDLSQKVKHGALDQQSAGNAAAVFVWSAIMERSTWKYLDRAYRYVFLDAGHIAQNLALAAEAIGYGSVQIGAFYDTEMDELLGFDGEDETVIYMTAVGSPRRSR